MGKYSRTSPSHRAAVALEIDARQGWSGCVGLAEHEPPTPAFRAHVAHPQSRSSEQLHHGHQSGLGEVAVEAWFLARAVVGAGALRGCAWVPPGRFAELPSLAGGKLREGAAQDREQAVEAAV